MNFFKYLDPATTSTKYSISHYTKSCLIFGLIILLSGCGFGRYEEVARAWGGPVYLDTQSITYNQSNGTATYWIKMVPDERILDSNKKRYRKENKIDETADPYAHVQYFRCKQEITINPPTQRTIEVQYIDKHDKLVPHTKDVFFAGYPTRGEKIYAAIIEQLQSQGKIPK